MQAFRITLKLEIPMQNVRSGSLLEDVVIFETIDSITGHRNFYTINENAVTVIEANSFRYGADIFTMTEDGIQA